MGMKGHNHRLARQNAGPLTVDALRKANRA